MRRPDFLAFALTLLLASTISAQFARPPAAPPRPPTPVIPRPIIIPSQPPSATQRPHSSAPITRPGPLPVVPQKPGMLALLGGWYAARVPTHSPPPVRQPDTPTRPTVNWPATLAVVGSAGSPEEFGPPPIFTLTPRAPRPAINQTEWVPWVSGIGVGVVLLGGLIVVFRPRGGRVRIYDVPPGEAPDWVRRAWVGIELPTIHREPRALKAIQVMSGDRIEELSGYEVSGPAAVAALSQVNPEAANWWRTNRPVFTMTGARLIFPANVCERLK